MLPALGFMKVVNFHQIFSLLHEQALECRRRRAKDVLESILLACTLPLLVEVVTFKYPDGASSTSKRE